MPEPQKYAVDMGWAVILDALGINPADVLRHAQLPADLFHRDAASVTSAEYFRLWSALDALSGDPMLPLRLAEVMSADAFSPAIFACLCSPNLNAALARLAKYKALIGPMRLEVDQGAEVTSLVISGLPGDIAPPPSFLAAELVFFTRLARLGLRDRVVPAAIECPVPLADPEAYAAWFGCKPKAGDSVRISFHRRNAERPFLTANPAMWAAFEPSLRLRLSEATAQVTTASQLGAWFNETIASGRTSIQDAACDLGVSTRTLQRRLAQEGTSFQSELSAAREALARHYLTRTVLSTAEIAFLLGYAEQNSFYRAFHAWTGLTPDTLRRDDPRAAKALL